MRLLIDADSLIYKAGCSNETREYLIQDKETGIVVHSCQYKTEADAYMQGDETLEAVLTKRAGEVVVSLGRAKEYIQKILDSVRFKDFQLYIGGKGNFRYDIFPEYKANRDPFARPIHEQEIRRYLIERWGAQEVHGEEVDDKVSYECCADPEGTCIVGIDKDLWNTPGWHFNPDKGFLEEVTEDTANRSFWKQMLTGDPSDGIPCLKGVGTKTADKLLAQGDHKNVVMGAYEQHGHSNEYFVLMGQLLWLRRRPEQMWTPELLD